MTLSNRTLSKTISHALRHEPWLYELELDAEGWTSLDTLIAALQNKGGCSETVTRQQIEEMIATSEKVRHEVRGDQIRALYGHSVPGRLKRTPASPPTTLYHGTSPKAAITIREQGIHPMGRQYVHLSADTVTAQQVGRRKAVEPVTLEIAAGEAHGSGVRFYEGNDKVWLADVVPPEFIRG